MAEFRTIIDSRFEEFAHWSDPDAGLEAFCAIHSTALGPAIGGTRWQPYADTTRPWPTCDGWRKR